MLTALFDHSAGRDTGRPLDEFTRLLPARWVVCLLADRDGRPVQLLCVKNLRACLKRRLAEEKSAGPAGSAEETDENVCRTRRRRVNYHELVGRVHWRAVDSSFEADWVYLEAARALFPGSYKKLVGFRPAWFVHIDPQADFPRYTRREHLLAGSGWVIGPLEDKKSADRLIQKVEDLFDLCRYYHILVQAPRGRACAYKDMGRCPAPCDGSISMEQYRRTVRESAEAIMRPGAFIEQQQQAMQQAAAGLRFELAARLKARIEAASQLGQGPWRHLRRIEDFRFISIQRGPRVGTAKVFLILPGQIEEVGGIIGEGEASGELLEGVGSASADRLFPPAGSNRSAEADPAATERIGLVSHHLFYGKPAEGAFLPLDLADNRAVLKAFREIQKHKTPEPAEDEGVVREMGGE